MIKRWTWQQKGEHVLIENYLCTESIFIEEFKDLKILSV